MPVGNRTRRAFRNRNRSVDPTSAAAPTYFPMGLPADMTNLLQTKADKQDLKDMLDIKSNKIDTEQTMRCIDILHKQTMHTVVLLIETLKTIVTDKKES